MASNDMNSWDEDPDERLRQRWQQLFAGFEVQARPSLSRRILAIRAAGAQRKRASRMANLLLLVLLCVGLFYPIRLGEKPESKERYGARTLSPPIQPHSRSGGTQPTVSTGRSTPVRRSGIDAPVNRSATGWQPPAYWPDSPKTEPSGMGTSAKRRSPIRQLASKPAVSGRRVGMRSGPNPVHTGRLLAERVRVPHHNGPIGPSAPLAIGDHKRLSAPAGQSISPDSLRLLPESALLAGQSLSNALPTDMARIKPTKITSLLSELDVQPGQLPAIRLASQDASVPVAGRRRYWFVKAAPLSSFQWMSTSPVSAAYLSQVPSPAAFSSATWGYQVYGGICLQRWRAYLSAGQLRRWANYTVNQNRYRLEPSPTNPYLVVRETNTVAENVALPIIGAGLSQVTFLAQGRYAVELGGQVSFLPTIGQRMVSLRGEVGRRIAMNQTIEFRLGLMAEYGVNRLASDSQQLIIHPFLVGISFQVQPRSLR